MTSQDDVPPELTPAKVTSPYVRVDEHGVMRVGNGRLMLDGIVIGFQEGLSAEAIHRRYPSASLEQVYGAIAYYLGNREAVDAYLRSQDALFEYWRAKGESEPDPVRERLRALKKQREAQRAAQQAGSKP
jgi:uncharacterized protein (DUF433 family)